MVTLRAASAATAGCSVDTGQRMAPPSACLAQQEMTAASRPLRESDSHAAESDFERDLACDIRLGFSGLMQG